MKKNILLLLLTIVISCNGQDNEIEKIKNTLEKSNKSMISTLNFMESGTIIRPAEPNEDEVLYESDFDKEFKVKELATINKEFEKEFDKIYFEQKLKYPSLTSSVKLRMDLYDLGRIFGNPYFYEEYDAFEIKETKIIFKNKSTKKIANFEENEWIDLKTIKPIDNIQIKIEYVIPIIQKLEFNKDIISATIENQTIRLKNLEKNKATFIIPKELEDKIIGVNGIYKNNKVLVTKGETSKELLTAEEKQVFKEFIEFQKQVIQKIDNKELKTKKEILTYIKRNEPKTAKINDNTKKNIALTYHFSGNLKSVNLFVRQEEPSVNEKLLTVKRYRHSWFSKFFHKINYFLIEDKNTEKTGVINLNGEVIIPVKYSSIRIFNNYFFSLELNDEYVLHRLNKKTNQLEKVNYKIPKFKSDYDYYKKYIIIESLEEEDKYGIVNCETGEIVVPMKYEIYDDVINKYFKK